VRKLLRQRGKPLHDDPAAPDGGVVIDLSEPDAVEGNVAPADDRLLSFIAWLTSSYDASLGLHDGRLSESKDLLGAMAEESCIPVQMARPMVVFQGVEAAPIDVPPKKVIRTGPVVDQVDATINVQFDAPRRGGDDSTQLHRNRAAPAALLMLDVPRDALLERRMCTHSMLSVPRGVELHGLHQA
jgi:hypothetical protein